ncbi:MAG: outer membrane beta-barrel protein [Balneola sp.]
MRKYALVLLALITVLPIVSAQDNRFGIKSGIAISGMSQQETEIGNVNINWEARSSFQTGVFYNRRLKNSLLSFQLELDYKKLGTGFRVRDIDQRVDPSAKANYEFEYVGFSVLPRIDLFPDKKINPNFMIGGIFEFKTNSAVVFTSDLPDPERSLNNFFFGGDTNNNTEKVLFGYVMAGGMEVATDPVIVTLEGRFTSLFSSVFSENVEELPLNSETYILKIMEDSRHNYFSFLIGFNFYFD